MKLRISILLLIPVLVLIPAVTGVKSADPVQIMTPEPPVLKYVTAITRDSVKITWQSNRETDTQGYDLFRRAGNVTVQVNEQLIPRGQTIYFDQALVTGEYTYYLTAKDDGGTSSGPSNEITVHAGPTVTMTILPREGVLVPGETTAQAVLIQGRHEFHAPDGLTVIAGPRRSRDFPLVVSIVPTKTVYLSPDTPEAVVMLAVYAPPGTDPGIYTASVRLFGISAEEESINLDRHVDIHVLSAEGTESRITLGSPTTFTRVGQPVNFFGRLVPLPADPDTRVSIRAISDAVPTIIIDNIPINDEGYFFQELVAPMTGIYRVTSFWAGDDKYDPAESDPINITVFKAPSRISCESNLHLGQTAGDIMGLIYPTPQENTPVMLRFRFHSSDGLQSFDHMATVYTTDSIPGRDGAFVLSVDFMDLFQPPYTPVPGTWRISAYWEGDEILERAHSETLVFPFLIDDLDRAIIVAAGDPRDQANWDAHLTMADYVLQVLLERGFQRDWITFLSASDTVPEADGPATLDNFRNAVANSGAQPGKPLHVYIIGPTDISQGMDKIAYTLNAQGERLTAVDMDQALNLLDPLTPQFLYLDGNFGGHFINSGLCRSDRLRNIIAFAGPGYTPLLKTGYLTLSRYFFTHIRQGETMAEAIGNMFGFLTDVPAKARFSFPWVEIAGLNPDFNTADCIPNQARELEPLGDYYLGFGRSPERFDPVVLGASGSLRIGKTPPSVESQATPEPRVGDSMGGIAIWVHCEDPEADLNAQEQYPVLLLVHPDGYLSLYGSEDFTPKPDGGFEIIVQESTFDQEGNYSAVLFQIDATLNLSSPIVTEITVINYNPEIILFGYGKTRLTQSGGYVELMAVVRDRNGIDDIEKVAITVDGHLTNLNLIQVGKDQEYGTYWIGFNLKDVKLTPGLALIGAQATDLSGRRSMNQPTLVSR